MRRALLALLLPFALVAACADAEGGGDDNEYADAISRGLQAEDDSPLATDDEQADCLGRGFVDALGGAEALEEADITPEELEESENPQDLGIDLPDDFAEGVSETFQSCDLDMSDLILAGIESSGTEVPDNVRECVEENLDEEQMADLFGEAFASGDLESDEPPPELMSALFDLASDCPELMELGG